MAEIFAGTCRHSGAIPPVFPTLRLFPDANLASPGRSDLSTVGVSSLISAVDVGRSGTGAGVGGTGRSGEHPYIGKLNKEFTQGMAPVKQYVYVRVYITEFVCDNKGLTIFGNRYGIGPLWQLSAEGAASVS